MRSSFRLLSAGGRVVAILAAATLAGCKQEIQFNRMPAVGPAIEAPKTAAQTRIFLDIPIDPAPILGKAEAAGLTGTIPVTTWMAKAVCNLHGRARECDSAKVEGTISRAGPISHKVADNKFWLVIPFAYTLQARASKTQTDQKTGHFEVSLPVTIELVGGNAIQSRIGEDWSYSSRDVQLLSGTVPLAQFVDPRLRKWSSGLASNITNAALGPLARPLIDRAWRALHNPIPLGPMQRGTAPNIYLRPEPLGLSGLGIHAGADGTTYRVAVNVKSEMHIGERPAPLVRRPLPEPTRAAQAQDTQLRLPFLVSAAPMRRAVEQAFQREPEMVTRAAPASPDIKVKVSTVDLFPSRDLLALELRLDVVDPTSWLGVRGNSYLVGKPVLTPDGKMIAVEDITFPEQRMEGGRKAQRATVAHSRGETSNRLGLEPFAGRFATAARQPLEDAELHDMLASVNTALKQSLEGDLTLGGAFDTATVVGVEPARDAFKIICDLQGTLVVRLDPSLLVTRATSSLEPTQWSDDTSPGAPGNARLPH